MLFLTDAVEGMRRDPYSGADWRGAERESEREREKELESLEEAMNHYKTSASHQ